MGWSLSSCSKGKAEVAFPERVKIVEVGPRDGFQMETAFIPTDLKVKVIDLVAEAGVSKVEATAFVSPEVIPQLRDSHEVMAGIRRRPGIRYTALVPNLKGMERALAAGVDGVRLVICATETYNQRNVGMSIAQSLEVCGQMLERAEPSGLPVEAVIAVAFGCPFEGEVSEDRVVTLARNFVDQGITELSIADSVGLANPVRIRRLLSRLQEEVPDIELSLHLHDTRGLGLANVLSALELGISAFDSSIGGLGGCPIMKGGTGNISTEDLVNMCHEMGLETGIDLDAIRRASREMERFLDRKLPSHVLAAGTREELFARSAASARS